MVAKITAAELREKSVAEIKEQLAFAELEYQRALQEAHSRSIDPEDLKTARKNVTRCKHILRESRLAELVEEFRGKKFIPKELRPKLNKNLRMRLTEEQQKKMTRRQAMTAAKTKLKIFSYQE